MRCTTILAPFLVLLAVPAAAQTTGVPGINGYTVDGLFPGSTSCMGVAVPGGGMTDFDVSASGPGLLTLRFFSPCPCTPCSLPILPSPCAIPAAPCAPFTDQVVDLSLFCPLLGPVPGMTDAAGVSSVAIFLPAGIAFSTQAVILDPACASPTFGLVVTQAYSVSTG